MCVLRAINKHVSIKMRSFWRQQLLLIGTVILLTQGMVYSKSITNTHDSFHPSLDAQSLTERREQIANGQQLLLPLSTGKGTSNIGMNLGNICIGKHAGATLSLQMTYQLVGHKLPKRRIVILTPRLEGSGNSIDLPPVIIYGKDAANALARSGQDREDANLHLLAKDCYSPNDYVRVFSWEPWMEEASLIFYARVEDGCGNVISSYQNSCEAMAAAKSGTYTPTDTLRIATKTDSRHFEGTAIIDFPTNGTEILPEFRNNENQLAYIHATIDSVLHNDRSLLQHITLKGYASPHGPYAFNELLARGRMQNLRRYISDRFDIPDVLIRTDYEAENWEGLRRYVESSQLPERQKLLELIDTNLDPDNKLARIAASYPTTYRYLVNNVFPTLRYTNYRIDYIGTIEDGMSAPTIQYAVGAAPAKPALFDSAAITPVPDRPIIQLRTYRPLLAVKSNLLFDLILAPNIEVEVPLGRDKRWSVMAEVWFPWYRYGYNDAGDFNIHLRDDQSPTKNAYQLLTIGAEVRYWLWPRCNAVRPTLSGTFFGLYAAGGKYDLGRNSKGDQGEFSSLGLTIGHAWALNRHLMLELSGSIGYVGGPRVHYENEFDDTHNIYRYNNTFRYVGPTKLKVSLGWLIGKKGGAR